jgi:hypothetical protein
MKRAAVTIDDTFIQGLAPLMPLFSQWSADVKNWLTAPAHVKEFGHLVVEFVDGLKEMVAYFQSKQFQSAMAVAKATTTVVGDAAKGVDHLGKAAGTAAYYASHPGSLAQAIKKHIEHPSKTGIVASADQAAARLWAHPNHETKKTQVADEELHKLFREWLAFMKKSYKPMSAAGTRTALQGHAAAHS